MDIVNKFKDHLFSQKNAPSAVTVKNYVSDVKRFITWYEKTYQVVFSPQDLSSEIIKKYQYDIKSSTQNSVPAARSAKRYISSLKRFCDFLAQSGAIVANPLIIAQPIQVNTDPFFLKEFSNLLYTERASKLTIKNYLADVKQFINWFEQVSSIEDKADISSLLSEIDNYTLGQYKMRLLREASLSPVSINRKLSSLRRYIRLLSDKRIVKNTMVRATPEKSKVETQEVKNETVIPDLPLTALQDFIEEKEPKESSYSYFGPVRFFQKMTTIITLTSDLLIFNPIAHIAEAVHYVLWKNGGKQIFAPVNEIIGSSSNIAKGVSIKTIIPKQNSILPPRSANLASVLKTITNYGIKTNPDTVRNFTKALYAPLKISTKQMHWNEKLIYHLRYTRPEWYRKYHSYALVNYIHLAIMILATVIAGSALYHTWTDIPGQKSAVLAAQATTPPRTLSFQGRLLDKTNTPITEETPLRFALYNSPTATGAALLWEEKGDIKPDRNGYFTATLGKKSRLDQQLFADNASLYIGIAINDNQELTPRQQIPTTNYAANAQTVEGLKPITDSPNLAQNVLLALDSAGNMTIGGNESHTFQATGGKFSLSGQALLLTTNPESNGNVQITPDGSGIIDLQKTIQNTSNNVSHNGIVGAVDVADILSVFATSSSQSALVVNQNGAGDIISGRRNGIDKFRLDGNGNGFFAGNVILKGDTIGTTSTLFNIAGSNVQTLTIGNNASSLSLGGSTGITKINNNLSVHGAVNISGLLTANAGLAIPEGKKLILNDFTAGAIPFTNSDHQLMQDANNFSWDDDAKAFHVVGSVCIKADTAGCGSTPGTIYATNTTVQAADLAENYVSSQNLEPGDLVIPEGSDNSMAIVKTTKPYQQQLIGIISTKPGVTLNSDAATDTQHPHLYPLALQGRVPVKVSSINGPIQAGDDLTSSAIPGVAMKASESGQIVGKALESFGSTNPNVIQKIMAFVNLSYHNAPPVLAENGNLAIATDSGSLANDTTSSKTLNNPAFGGITNAIALAMIKAQNNIMIGQMTLKDYVASVVQEVVNKDYKKQLTQLSQSSTSTNIASNSAVTTDQTASQSGTLSATASAELQPNKLSSASASLIYNSIASGSAPASNSAQEELLPSPTPFLQTASGSGSLGTTSMGAINNHYASVSTFGDKLSNTPNFTSDFATFNQGLIALGPSSLTDVAVSNYISVNNNLKITADSLDTIGSDLNIQPLRQGNVQFMGGLVAIDTQGNLQVNGNALFAHDATVKGTLSAGIIAPIPQQDLAINLTNKSNKSGSSLKITNATGNNVLQINQSGDLTSSGEAKFNTVASQGFSIIRGAQADTSTTETVANGSAGNGIISPHEPERTIITPYVTDHSLIYITVTSNNGTLTPYLARQTAANPQRGIRGSFTIAIPSATTKPIRFNWWIVN